MRGRRCPPFGTWVASSSAARRLPATRALARWHLRVCHPPAAPLFGLPVSPGVAPSAALRFFIFGSPRPPLPRLGCPLRRLPSAPGPPASSLLAAVAGPRRHSLFGRSLARGPSFWPCRCPGHSVDRGRGSLGVPRSARPPFGLYFGSGSLRLPIGASVSALSSAQHSLSSGPPCECLLLVPGLLRLRPCKKKKKNKLAS